MQDPEAVPPTPGHEQLLELPDRSGALVAYDLSGYENETRQVLLSMLSQAGIRHDLSDELELFVRPEDEEAVDEMFDLLSFPDELPAEDDYGEDPVAIDLLGEVFVAADRLRKDGSNGDAMQDLLDATEELATLSVPFGFDPKHWDEISDLVQGFCYLLATEPMIVEIEERAEELWGRLRPLV